jgi:hypothetical protein
MIQTVAASVAKECNHYEDRHRDDGRSCDNTWDRPGSIRDLFDKHARVGLVSHRDYWSRECLAYWPIELI